MHGLQTVTANLARHTRVLARSYTEYCGTLRQSQKILYILIYCLWMAIAFILSPTREPNGVRGYTNESTEASKSFKQAAFRPKIVDAAESIVLSRWPCLLSFDWAAGRGGTAGLGFIMTTKTAAAAVSMLRQALNFFLLASILAPETSWQCSSQESHRTHTPNRHLRTTREW